MATGKNLAFLQNNCTSCHMPLQYSMAIHVSPSNHAAAIPIKVVNHRIAIYPEETKQVLKNQSVTN
jgi:hypothetical protein